MLFVAAFLSFSIVRTNYVNVLNANAAANELLTDEFVKKEILTQSGEFEENQNEYVFNNVRHLAPARELKSLSMRDAGMSAVLGSTTEEKHIVVDLEKQRVYAYEGDRVVMSFLVSTGKYGATPTGSYKIWYKVRSQTMKGGNPALGTYYYLPNVQWIQYFNNGIGFHSTYWHNNYGTPMSHGCINMTTTDAETLYHWASPVLPSGIKIFRSSPDNPGTRVDVVQSWKI
jgi:lipoprotein-anchoring transpeptidase ErfK/SrfK